MATRSRPLDNAELLAFIVNGSAGDLLSTLKDSAKYLPILERFFTDIGKHMTPLISIEDTITRLLPNSAEVNQAFEINGRHVQGQDRGSGQNAYILRIEGNGVHLISGVHEGVRAILIPLIRSYSLSLQQYTIDVKPYLRSLNNGDSKSSARLAQLSGLHLPALDSLPEKLIEDVEKAKAADVSHTLVHEIINGYLKIKGGLFETIGQVYKIVGFYNKFLRERFIKHENPQPRSPQKMIFIRDSDPDENPYLKIKLIEGNPVLTDILLNLYNEIPPIKSREIQGSEKRKKPRIVKEISSYAVEECCGKITALSTPEMITYMQTPETFFSGLGAQLQSFYAIVAQMDPSYQELLIAHPAASHDQVSSHIDDTLTRSFERISHVIGKVSHCDFDNIVQQKDETLPESKREKDYFALREQLLLGLFKGMKDISRIKNLQKKDSRAKELVMEAVSLRAKIDELLESTHDRRLRKNRMEENEFYVGRQAEIGRFTFAREATPQVSIDDVKGASFEPAKQHLLELKHMGRYPNLMEASAPGRKVRGNMLWIGPYGCGKTELARAACADKDVIGASVSVTAINTAYMHETPNNVKRVYDAAKKIRQESLESKVVLLIIDEFNGWFQHGNGSSFGYTDMKQIETTLLEVLDGMEDYNGIISICLTNDPLVIPHGILRRFRYVDIVGQLTKEERADILKMYFDRTLPTHPDVETHYLEWAEKLDGAPGDVVRKVADEIHFTLLPRYVRERTKDADRVERVLTRHRIEKGTIDQHDSAYVKRLLGKYHQVNPDEISHELDVLLKKPHIHTQINDAKKVYRDAELLMQELSKPEGDRFGLRRESKLFQG